MQLGSMLRREAAKDNGKGYKAAVVTVWDAPGRVQDCLWAGLRLIAGLL